MSDGYWASEQNIYSLFHYMDRKGKLFTAEECRRELAEYKKRSHKYAKKKQKTRKGGSLLSEYQKAGRLRMVLSEKGMARPDKADESEKFRGGMRKIWRSSTGKKGNFNYRT